MILRDIVFQNNPLKIDFLFGNLKQVYLFLCTVPYGTGNIFLNYISKKQKARSL